MFLNISTLTTIMISFLLFYEVSSQNTHAGVAFWMQTGERQTARLRVKYIQCVLKQDMSFFDTQARNENILYHITSDAVLIQDAIGDKVSRKQQIYLTTWLCSSTRLFMLSPMSIQTVCISYASLPLHILKKNDRMLNTEQNLV